MSLLSTAETRLLQLERGGEPLHHGVVLVLDAKPLRDDSGQLDMNRIRDRVFGRLHRAPRSRQRVRRHGALASSRWVWRDDAEFDIAYHVRHSAVPFPGDDEHLVGLINRILANRLDLDRPLWELYLMEGLADNRVAMVYKSHPLMAGTRADAVDVLTALIDSEDEVAADDPDLWEPLSSATPVQVLGEMVGSSVTNVNETAISLLDTGGNWVRGTTKAVSSLTGGKPRLPWEVDITAHRRFELVRVPLDRVVEAKRKNGCSFNDVVLAACTQALRTFLESRDVPVEGRDVNALLPIAVASDREREAPGFAGGRLRMIDVSLPVGESEPSARLDRIAAQLSRVRADRRVLDAATMVELDEFAAPSLLAQASREGASIDDRLVVVNVPGSQSDRWFFGSEVLEVFPYLAIRSGRALTIATISHGNLLGFGITGDRSRMPDLHHFARYLSEALDALT